MKVDLLHCCGPWWWRVKGFYQQLTLCFFSTGTAFTLFATESRSCKGRSNSHNSTSNPFTSPDRPEIKSCLYREIRWASFLKLYWLNLFTFYDTYFLAIKWSYVVVDMQMQIQIMVDFTFNYFYEYKKERVTLCLIHEYQTRFYWLYYIVNIRQKKIEGKFWKPSNWGKFQKLQIMNMWGNFFHIWI